MLTAPLATVQAAGAQAAATTDRDNHADWLLDVAVKNAITALRNGQPGRAEFILGHAGIRADRILGHRRTPPTRTPLRPFTGNATIWRVAWSELAAGTGQITACKTVDCDTREQADELVRRYRVWEPMVYEIPIEVVP